MTARDTTAALTLGVAAGLVVVTGLALWGIDLLAAPLRRIRGEK